MLNLFIKLRNQFQPQAKLVFQYGNNWNPMPGIHNHLSSAVTVKPPSGDNVVYYHQEFDSSVFCPAPVENPRSVVSLLHFHEGKDSFFQVEPTLPAWKFHSYGAGNRDGCCNAIQELVIAFHNHGFLWHEKKEGDGYGFNLHHAAATGTPIITRKRYFNGMTVAPLLIHGETCIDLDQVSNIPLALEQAAANHSSMSAAIYSKFNQVVNFDAEEVLIRKFLERLI